MSILDHFWKIILFLVIAGLGYYFWTDHQRRKNFDLQVQVLADLMKPEDTRFSARPDANYSQYYQLIGRIGEIQDLQRTQKDPMPTRELLNMALDKTDYSPRVLDIVKQALEANLETCEKLNIFAESSDNRFLLEAGKPPVIQRGPYRKEKLLIGHILAPTYAREVMNHFGNFSFLPESVWAMQPDLINSDARRTAQQFSGAKLIREATFKEIKDAYSVLATP